MFGSTSFFESTEGKGEDRLPPLVEFISEVAGGAGGGGSGELVVGPTPPAPPPALELLLELVGAPLLGKGLAEEGRL